MKRFIALLFVLAVMSVLGTGPVSAYTSVKDGKATGNTSAPVPTPTPMRQQAEYFLPYPGILPTHPLYFLKNIRDTIIESLITDPVPKTEFYILQSDKKLNMGIFLGVAGKADDADRAFRDALDAHDKSLAIAESGQAAGKPLPRYVLEKLIRSITKHAEVLTERKSDTATVSVQKTKAESLLGQP